MKKILFVLASLFLLFSTTAIAQTNDPVCYDLWCANAAPDGVTYLTDYIPYARVCLAPKTDCSINSGVTITVTANESIFGFVPGPGGTNFGIQKFGFNYTGTPGNIVATVTGADATKAANWSVVAGPSQVDGFGTFIEVAAPSTNPPGQYREQPLVISICSNVTNLSVSDFVVPNASSPAQHFAVHIAGFTTVNGVQYYYDSDKNGTLDAPLNSAYFGNCNELTVIELASFTAKGKKLTWVTESEIDNSGFNIWRADAEAGPYVQLNDEIIPAKGSAVQGAKYTFTDKTAQGKNTYFYELEDIDVYGNSTFHGPVSN
jgi:hypothetical protein